MSGGVLLHGASPQRVAFSLAGEKAQFAFFVLAEVVAITRLVIVRRKLLQELLYTMLFPYRVHVGDFVIGQIGEVQMDLKKKEKKIPLNLTPLKRFIYFLAT